MRVGERVELIVYGKGENLSGVIVALIEQRGRVTSVRVKMDRSGRVLRLDPSRVETV